MESIVRWSVRRDGPTHRGGRPRGPSNHIDELLVWLGEDTAEESRSLLDFSVNADWDETAADLDEIDAVTDDATKL